MRDYRKLEVWQLSKQIAVDCYLLTDCLPRDEVYGIRSQLRRSCVSIPSNIAEGVGRDSDADFLRFLRIALGSLNEAETLLLIAMDLQMLEAASAMQMSDRFRDLGVRIRNLVTKIESGMSARSSRRAQES
jgi:four helix bundle protein